MDVYRKCCVMCGYRRLRRLSRGVVPTVLCLSVIAEPRGGGGLGLLGLSSHEKNIIHMYWRNFFLVVNIRWSWGKNISYDAA